MTSPGMNLWQLHIFCKVVELKSFSLAGKTVHLSQPTVSSHIKDLEDQFDCQLIDRLAKAATPTKAGRLLYTYACRLLALSNETEAAMAEFQGKIKGQLDIGGSTIPGTYLLPQYIGSFIAEYPQVNISLVINDTAQVANDILSGVLELAVVGARHEDRRLRHEKFVEDEMRLIVPADHPWANQKSISPGKLCREPFIMREIGSGTRRSLLRNLEKKGLSLKDLNIVAEMGSTEAITQGIKHRIGISILSRIAVAEALSDGRLRSLTVQGLELKRAFYLVHHKNRSLSPLGRTFIDFIRTTMDDACKT